MTTLQLINEAKKINATISFEYENQIGIKLNNQFVFHWFDVLGDNVYYTKSYSQSTGKTNKYFKTVYNKFYQKIV